MKALPDAVKQFLTDAPVCRIASARSDGKPHVIPVCPVFDGENTVYVDITAQGVTARGFRENPRITALFDVYDDDWSNLKAVVLTCRAEPVEGEELDRAWGMFRRKFPQGEPIGWSPRLTLALRIERWTEWGLVVALPYDEA